MDIADKIACAELVQAWGFARDQGKWDALLDTFHAGGQIHVSWFQGAFPDFVERCRQNYGKGSTAKHLLWPARVQVNGDRATAETNVAIMVRQVIVGIESDLISNSRFLDRLEKRDGTWRMAERACVYEQDRLDPVEHRIDPRSQAIEGVVPIGRERDPAGEVAQHDRRRVEEPLAERAVAL